MVGGIGRIGGLEGKVGNGRDEGTDDDEMGVKVEPPLLGKPTRSIPKKIPQRSLHGDASATERRISMQGRLTFQNEADARLFNLRFNLAEDETFHTQWRYWAKCRTRWRDG